MKVFITTSGVGSRLGNLTKYTNKSMIKIGKKPAISHIIEQYPEDYEFVISLGYFGSHTEQFLKLAYPNRKFIFVTVENYDGPGSSQIHSQLCAREHLQEPFIYNDCDTIVEDLMSFIPENWDYDWLGGYPTSIGDKTNYSLYDSFDIDRAKGKKDGSYKVTNMYRKSECEDPHMLYIGISGIYDYEKFWDMLERTEKEQPSHNLSDFAAYKIYNPFENLRCVAFYNWEDTGSIAGIIHARETCKDKLPILDKNDQGIFMIVNKVIKFFARPGVASNLLKRYIVLNKWSHDIVEQTENFITYDYIEGDVAIKNMTPTMFKSMLEFFNESGLWFSDVATDAAKESFLKDQYDFYIKKTMERVQRFKEMYSKEDESEDVVVNGELIPAKYTIEYMISQLPFMFEYQNANYSGWHGDFVLDNMLKTPENKFVLIDPREKFGSKISVGDKLYDFAKMNHNLTFNFSSATKGLFTIEQDKNNIHCSILCNNEVYECKEVLKEFVEKQNISWEFIEFMTGLIWVNMSPLHWDPLTKWLFYFGKLTMYRALKKYEAKFGNYMKRQMN